MCVLLFYLSQNSVATRVRSVVFFVVLPKMTTTGLAAGSSNHHPTNKERWIVGRSVGRIHQPTVFINTYIQIYKNLGNTPSSWDGGRAEGHVCVVSIDAKSSVCFFLQSIFAWEKRGNWEEQPQPIVYSTCVTHTKFVCGFGNKTKKFVEFYYASVESGSFGSCSDGFSWAKLLLFANICPSSVCWLKICKQKKLITIIFDYHRKSIHIISIRYQFWTLFTLTHTHSCTNITYTILKGGKQNFKWKKNGKTKTIKGENRTKHTF